MKSKTVLALVLCGLCVPPEEDKGFASRVTSADLETVIREKVGYDSIDRVEYDQRACHCVREINRLSARFDRIAAEAEVRHQQILRLLKLVDDKSISREKWSTNNKNLYELFREQSHLLRELLKIYPRLADYSDNLGSMYLEYDLKDPSWRRRVYYGHEARKWWLQADQYREELKNTEYDYKVMKSYLLVWGLLIKGKKIPPGWVKKIKVGKPIDMDYDLPSYYEIYHEEIKPEKPKPPPSQKKSDPPNIDPTCPRHRPRVG